MNQFRTLCAARWFFATAFMVIGVSVGDSAEQGSPKSLQVKKEDGIVSVVTERNSPVLAYAFGDVPFKPYIKKLFTPGGVQVLRDSPSDHKHHHALMFATSADGIDFWSETPACGQQVTIGTAETKAASLASSADHASRASFTFDVQWQRPDKTPVLNETRTIVAYHDDGLPATLVTWQSRLEPPPGKDSVTLTGAHYVGLGMRFVTSMDTGGRFITLGEKQGDVIRGTERVLPAPWCAYTASANGKPLTIALFDYPDNPRHPAPMFTMTAPFAYLSATLNLWKEPLVIRAGKPVVLRYGVAGWDGQVDPTAILQVYRRWVQLAGNER